MTLKTLPPNAFYDMVAGMPTSLHQDNDGSYLYRYNIRPQMDKEEESKEAKQIGWECREIRIWEYPTRNALKKAIIRSVVDETQELALLNAYNKHTMGIKECPEALENYKAFLLFSEELDEMLSNDIKE